MKCWICIHNDVCVYYQAFKDEEDAGKNEHTEPDCGTHFLAHWNVKKGEQP